MRRSGVLQCLLAAVLFGASAPAASKLAGSIPAFTLAGLLYVGAAAAVLPIVLRRPPLPEAVRAEWRPALVAVVVGGAIGPVLLVAGLARTSAATASILLNTELVATVVFAAVLFREHLGSRLLTGAALITGAGVLLTWKPGAAVDIGAVFIVAACACWGLDNGVTAKIEQLAPQHVVALKGVVAGGANLTIGLLVAGLGPSTGFGDVVAALAIGAAGYGASITLWVQGARELGAARGQVIFATAPFIGAGVAWSVLGEDIAVAQIVAIAIAGIGVAIAVGSDHEHSHRHEPLVHDHAHDHDDGHHDHDHADLDRADLDHADLVSRRHSHRHQHRIRVHTHPHVPDLHHRHDHSQR